MIETTHATAVPDQDIIDAIGDPGARIERRPWDYTTSAPLELVSVRGIHGDRDFILKHLAPGEMSKTARRVKPLFAIDPRREIEVYRSLLAPLGEGPRLTGSRANPKTGVYWLLIERVDGARLYESDVADWSSAAGWLGRFQSRVNRLDVSSLRSVCPLITYEPEWYRLWLDRARRFFAADGPADSRRGRDALEWLASRYERVIERLVSLPHTILHGELYPANVLIARASDRRVVAIDWEMAAWGPAVIDLAALTSGDWPEADRKQMVDAYRARGADPSATSDVLSDDIAYAQIFLSVQWLGWFGRRRPPAAHARDWLADAVDRAEALGL